MQKSSVGPDIFWRVRPGRGEGPAGIQNYESKKIAERHYEFTYRFQEDDYNNANDNCN